MLVALVIRSKDRPEPYQRCISYCLFSSILKETKIVSCKMHCFIFHILDPVPDSRWNEYLTRINADDGNIFNVLRGGAWSRDTGSHDEQRHPSIYSLGGAFT